MSELATAFGYFTLVILGSVIWAITFHFTYSKCSRAWHLQGGFRGLWYRIYPGAPVPHTNLARTDSTEIVSVQVSTADGSRSSIVQQSPEVHAYSHISA